MGTKWVTPSKGHDMNQATATLGTLYTETVGTNCTLDGFGHGVVTGTLYGPGVRMPEVRRAFVKLDSGPMLVVELGATVSPCVCWTQSDPSREHNPLCSTNSDRNAWREAISARVINRDEFDSITDLATARIQMGWRG